MALNTRHYRNNHPRSPMPRLPKRQTWHSRTRVLQEALVRGFLILGVIPWIIENPCCPLAKWLELDSTDPMIRPGFLDKASRQELIELARDGSAAHRLARRANALVLLDDGMSCTA